MKIGATIREIRKGKNPVLKQYQLAQNLGISQTYLSQLEKGSKEASPDLIKKIANALDTPLPVFILMSVEESDIPEHKRAAHKQLTPILLELLNEVKDDVSSKKCDSCGESFIGETYPINDENNNPQRGLIQCSKCFDPS